MTGRLSAFGTLVFALVLAAIRPATADVAEDVRALAERAVAHLQDVGLERGFIDITRPDGGFVQGDLYVFCDDVDGVGLAHGGNPKLVGKAMIAIRDPDGTPTTAEIIRVAKTQGRGWVEYLWPNPATGRIQRKVTYVIQVDPRTVCASGYYKPGPP
jgi:cytochrome c